MPEYFLLGIGHPLGLMMEQVLLLLNISKIKTG